MRASEGEGRECDVPNCFDDSDLLQPSINVPVQDLLEGTALKCSNILISLAQ